MFNETAEYKVVVIDNELEDLSRLNKILEEAGMKVIPAYIYNVFSLLNKEMPNALFVNANINIKIALKLLNFIRERFPGLPVLLLTANRERLSKTIMTRLGISGFIYNPYEIKEILPRIQYTLKRKEL